MPSMMLRPSGSRMARLAAGAALLLLAGCSQFSLPFAHRTPDLTPAADSADNMVRLDAAMRSGCPEVRNIEKPPGPLPSNNNGTQRWVARTCTGDIAYDVVTTTGPDGPIVKVLPVDGPLNNPMNPHFIPAQPGQ